MGAFRRASPISEARDVEMTLYNATFEYDIANFATLLSSTNYKTVDTTWQVDLGSIPGLGDLDREALGIPSEAQYVARYCERMGIGDIPNWNFYLVFSFFRVPFN